MRLHAILLTLPLFAPLSAQDQEMGPAKEQAKFHQLIGHWQGSGKVKAWSQAAVMIALILMGSVRGVTGSGLISMNRYGMIFMWIVVVVAVWSGIDYIWANRKVFRI